MFDECIDEYIFSGSLPENASTYVKREADDELYEALHKGKFCYVLNSRQSGKSSLRLRTMSRLSETGVECASIDLSSINIQGATQENWYADLITILINSFVLDVNFKDWWEKNKLNSPLMRFTNFLEKHLLAEIEESIVIFIDEIDSVLSLDFPTDDFFAFIRACHNQRVDNPAYKRLTFCLLGVASPSNLIQDKQRTPFNIGKAISLKGFKLEEVKPLERGLRGKFNHPQVVMQEILNWTGGQPFLTQKLCQFMLEESEKENPRTVEQVVFSRIIKSWESQDEPEHLRTIRARLLRNEERAAYLLELYQQIVDGEVESSITADNTIEQSELLLSGLVARREGKLKVYNAIYKEVFNQNWVENELNNLRSYSESFKFWVASGGKDESRLLRGKALVDAEEWAKDKNLSYQDKQFLAASREKEIQSKIAAEEQEAQLERERKDREAAEQRNQVLSEANIKAKRLIRNGTVVLALAVLGAVSSGVFAAIEGNKALEAQKRANDANQKELEATQKFENVNTKAKQEREKVITLQKQAQQVEKKFKVIEKQVQLAIKKASAEKLKAEQAERKANAAKLEAIESRKQAQKAQQNAGNANRKAVEAKKIADDANIEAQASKRQAQDLQNKLVSVKKDIENVQQLSKLAGELRNENLTAESDDALRQAGLSFRVSNHNLKQAMLLASISQAYQNLTKPDKAKKAIDESLHYLNSKGNKTVSNEGLQIKFLVKANQGNLISETYPKRAIKAYIQAYENLKKYPTETNPFEKNKILTTKDIESVHRGILKLQSNRNKEVWASLKEHFYAELENLLKLKKPNWKVADEKTWRLMLFIANREGEGWLDIPQLKNFSCGDLRRIDKLWVENSKGYFGFSVQKKIWVKTGNRLGVQEEDLNENDIQNYLRFANTVGWHNKILGSKYEGIQITNEIPQSVEYFNSRVRGSLPWLSVVIVNKGNRRFSQEKKATWINSAKFSRVETCKI